MSSTFKIVQDWLQIDGQPAARFDTPHQGGRMTASVIVMHDTAGRLARNSSVAWFMRPEAKASAHFVVERDGAVTQLVACDRQAWHAGKSTWRGRANCNAYSVGIEIVNPGRMTAKGESAAVAWFGQVFKRNAYGIEERATDHHGRGCWMPYTPEQIAVVEQLIAALREAYPSITEVVGHYQISPGRKVDPNPLLPARLLGQLKRPGIAALATADVARAQKALATKGYFPGAADGDFGPRTEAAVFAFQRQNGVPANGKLTADLVDRIDHADAKEMPTGAREWVTETTLAGQSRIVDENRTARAEAQGQVLLAGMLTVATLLTQLGQIIKQAVLDYGVESVVVVVCGGLAAWGIRTWRRANRVIGYRVEDAKSGAHLGRG